MSEEIMADAGEIDASSEVEVGGGGEEQDTSYSTLEEASDEDISSYLSSLRKAEDDGLPVDEIIAGHQEKAFGVKQQDDGSSVQPSQQQEQKQETKPEYITKEQHERAIQELTARIQMEQVQNAQKESEIQKRRGRIGELTQEIKSLQARLADGLEDLAVTNPLEAMERREKIKENAETLKDLESENQAIQFEENAKELFKRTAPNYIQYTIDDMAEVLERDGLNDPNVLKAFKANPFRFTYPEALVQIAHRAAERKVALQLLEVNKKLTEKLQKGMKSEQSVVDSIQRAARTIPTMTANRGDTPEGEVEFSDRDFASMSDAELNALTKKFYKQR